MKKFFSLVLALAAATTLAFADDQQTVSCGTTVKIQANADRGYQFKQWNDGSIANPREVIVMDNLTYTAQFEALTPSTLTLASNDDAKGSVIITSSLAAPYYAGDEITIKAVPADDCQEFLYWLDENGNTNVERTITITAGENSYTAVFGTKELNVKIEAGTGGSVLFVTD